jgi:hypothetical protein
MIMSARRSLAFDPSRFDSLTSPLLVGWVVTSTAALLYLAAAIVGMRRLPRGMLNDVIDGHRVLVSRNIGPALIGVLRARIVLPRWAAELCETERRLVLAHESEHASAGDPVLLVAGVGLAAVQAWNAALWIAVARLRFAIEADCDARVLARSVDVRSYARLLIRVHTQSAPMFAARLAFTGTTSRLESRIRRLLGTGRPRKIASAALAASCLIVVIASACFAPTPVRVYRDQSAPLARVATPQRPSATLDSAIGRAQTADQKLEPLEAAPAVAQSDRETVRPIEAQSRAPSTESPSQQGFQGLGCGRQAEGFLGPTFGALQRLARERHGDLFDQVQTTATVIAFAVDGASCMIVRDTVITIPLSGSYSANVLYSRAFPDLPEHAPEIGLGDARERQVPPIRGNPPLMILYAMNNVPRERASCQGVSVPTNSICTIDGEVVIRVMDSLRVLVATENQLFMFTSADPITQLVSRTLQFGHIEYADGAVSVRNLGDRTFVLSVRNGKPSPLGDQAAWRLDAGVGLSHYSPTPVPLDAIGRLKVAPCKDDDAPVGSCFGVDDRLIRFPR